MAKPTKEQLDRILGNQSVVQRAFAENRPTVTNTPRSIVSGTYADLLKPATNNIVGDILLGDIQRGLNSASYSQPLTTGGSVQTGGFRPEYLALALGLTPMGKGKKAAEGFSELAASGKIVQAKNRTQEIDDLVKGKSKFAEVKLNWDDPKSYDLADKLEKQGFMSTVIDQGRDQVTLFHKKPEDIASIVNAKTPYDYGKAYGYSEADVANFYKQRYGKEAEQYFQQDRKFTPKKTEYEVAQETARRNATLPIAEGGLGLPATNTAMDRAKAMGFDINNPMYHGTQNDILNFDKSKIGSRFPYSFGYHTTTSPNEASVYADSITNAAENFNPKSKFAKPIAENANVMKLYGRTENPLRIKTDYPAASMEADIQRSEIIDKLYNAQQANNPYDSVIIDAKNNKNFIALKPELLRSPNAAFDPFRRNEADILAGVGVGVPTAGLLDEKKKKK